MPDTCECADKLGPLADDYGCGDPGCPRTKAAMKEAQALVKRHKGGERLTEDQLKELIALSRIIAPDLNS